MSGMLVLPEAWSRATESGDNKNLRGSFGIFGSFMSDSPGSDNWSITTVLDMGTCFQLVFKLSYASLEMSHTPQESRH